VVLERASVVSDANPGTEEEGVVAVERGGWLDDDGSCRVRHEIFGEIPYLACQLSVFETGNLPRGVPEVDECGLTEIGNSKDRHVAHNLDRFGP
jgi:hypothetical protein